MKVKELKKKYKGYEIVMYGKPFEVPTIPFTFLPKDKKIDDSEIVDIRIKDKEVGYIGVSFKDLKALRKYKYKGVIEIVVK